MQVSRKSGSGVTEEHFEQLPATKVRLFIRTLFLLFLNVGQTDAQYSPIGAHYAPMGNASGFGSSTISPTGTYNTSVPLDLPQPRGDLPLPVQVVYDGGNQVGEAGVGWSLPLSYVMYSNTLSRRKPTFSFQSTSALGPVGRVFLNIGGKSMLMNSMSVANHYRPMIADEYLELVKLSQTQWIAHDLAGREYTFSHIEGSNDNAFWFLTEIRDRTRRNRIEFEYGVASLSSAFEELSLKEITYSYSGTWPTGCPKHRVSFEYSAPANSGTLGYVVDHGRGRVRTKLLQSIVVWSHTDASCADAPTILRAYNFFYEPDQDTQLPRLVSVRLSGRGSPSAEALPVVAYKYGSATKSVNLSTRSLLYTQARSMPFPAGASEAVKGAFASMLYAPGPGPHTYGTRQLVTDFTGDGLPDYIYPDASGKLNLARNITSSTGTILTVPPATGLLFPTITVALTELSKQTTTRWLYADRHPTNFVYTWIQIIDWNGDGRLDFVDALGGKGPTGRSSPDHWRVLLNTPSSTAAGTGIEWRERHVLISYIRAELQSRGYGFVSNSEPLPLARSQTGGRAETHDCFEYVLQPGVGYILQRCTDLEETGAMTGSVYPFSRTSPGSTITEWKLIDANGDGFSDFVYNSKPVKLNEEYGCSVISKCNRVLPFDGTTGPECPIPFPTEFVWYDDWMCLNYTEINLPDDNDLRVFFNNSGSLPFPLRAFEGQSKLLTSYGGTCGVERWLGKDNEQWMECGFVEINGDGLIDRVVDEGALLNTGTSNGFYSSFSIGLPGAPVRIKNGHFEVCDRNELAPLPGDTQYNLQHVAALTDVTGDGIPDYVSLIEDNNWQVRIGTGSGYAEAIGILAPEQDFELSLVQEQCDGRVSRTVAGLVDIDGDGRPDVVRAIAKESSNPGELLISKLSGSSAVAGAHDAGRLIAIDNGYGGSVIIGYGSAKIDTRTDHQVPFAEIVVSRTTSRATKSLGSSFEPVLYAYGRAYRRYHALLGRWVFPGYGRVVIMRGSGTGGPPDAPPVTTAEIVDAIVSPELPLGPTSYAFLGRIRDRHLLQGRFNNPWLLLDVNVSSDQRIRGTIHTDHGTVGDSPQAFSQPECYDIDTDEFVWTGPDPWNPTEAPSLCRTAFIVFASETSTWMGHRTGPKAHSMSRTRVLAMDEFGRRTLMELEHDVARPEDDICLALAYASSISSTRIVLDAVSTARLTNCTPGQETIYRGARYSYDHLPEGTVGGGLLTQRIIERYQTDTGAKLDEYRLEEISYDEYGNPIFIRRTRGDGVTRSTTLHYDTFGLAPEFIIESASDIAIQLITTAVYDPVSLLPSIVFDANNVQHRTYYDTFDRPVLKTVVTYPDKIEYPLTQFEYFGDDPSDSQGRRIKVQTVNSWVPMDSTFTDLNIAASDATESVAYFDEFGRQRFVKHRLGDDYTDNTLITEYVQYDGHGRVAFAAAPFGDSEVVDLSTDVVGTSVYGTTYHYDESAGTVCYVDGQGREVLAVTSETLGRYPTCVRYFTFADYKHVHEVRGPNELLSTSPQGGAYDEIQTSAIGWVLARSRWQDGTRIEHSEYDYDRLGHLERIRRSTAPGDFSAPTVDWEYTYDSMGQVLEGREPAAALVKRSYDEWGNLTRILSGEASVVYNYDGFSRVKSITGNLYGRRDAEASAEFSYDVASSDPAHGSPSNLTGRLSYSSDPLTKSFFGYDALGRMSALSQVPQSDGQIFAERYMLSPSSQLSELTFRLPGSGNNETLRYDYDSARNLRRGTWEDSTGTTVLFEVLNVDARGRYLEILLGNGVRETYVYRENQRRELRRHMAETAWGNLTTVYGGFAGDGRLKGRIELSSPNDSTGTAEQTLYRYDSLNRLARAWTLRFSAGDPPSGQLIRDAGFIYDGLGNLTEMSNNLTTARLLFTQTLYDPDRICNIVHVPGSSDPISDWNITPMPMLTPVYLPRVFWELWMLGMERFRCTYSYDQAGNVIAIDNNADAPRVFTYDAQSRLVGMERDGLSAKLTYDAFGNLSDTMILSADGRARWHDRRYGQLIEEVTIGNDSPLIERRIPGPLGVIATLHGTGPNAALIYQHNDFNGNRLFTDKVGAIVTHLGYEPYGLSYMVHGSEPSPKYTRYLWNGGKMFPEFAAIQLGARFYDPATGRFLQRDPLVVARPASQMNPYMFALGDPINFGDPTGLQVHGCDPLIASCDSGYEYFPGVAATAAELLGDLFGGRKDKGDNSLGTPTPDLENSPGRMPGFERPPPVGVAPGLWDVCTMGDEKCIRRVFQIQQEARDKWEERELNRPGLWRGPLGGGQILTNRERTEQQTQGYLQGGNALKGLTGWIGYGISWIFGADPGERLGWAEVSATPGDWVGLHYTARSGGTLNTLGSVGPPVRVRFTPPSRADFLASKLGLRPLTGPQLQYPTYGPGTNFRYLNQFWQLLTGGIKVPPPP